MYSSASVANKTCFPSPPDSPAILFEGCSQGDTADYVFAPNAGTVQCFNMADQTKKICCENKDSSIKVDLIKCFYSLKKLFLTFRNFYK